MVSVRSCLKSSSCLFPRAGLLLEWIGSHSPLSHTHIHMVCIFCCQCLATNMPNSPSTRPKAPPPAPRSSQHCANNPEALARSLCVVPRGAGKELLSPRLRHLEPLLPPFRWGRCEGPSGSTVGQGMQPQGLQVDGVAKGHQAGAVWAHRLLNRCPHLEAILRSKQQCALCVCWW